jgi:hypothetical protein
MRIQCFPGVNLRFRANTQFEAAFPASSPASTGPANPIFPPRRIDTLNADASGRTRSRFANRQKHVKGVVNIHTTRDYFICGDRAGRPPRVASLPARRDQLQLLNLRSI